MPRFAQPYTTNKQVPAQTVVGNFTNNVGSLQASNKIDLSNWLGLGTMATQDASDYLPITGSIVSNPVALDSVGNSDKLLTFGNAAHCLRKDGAVIGTTFGRENGGANGNFTISGAGYKLGGTQYVGFVPIGANALSSNPDVTVQRIGPSTIGVFESDRTTLGAINAATFENPNGITAVGNPTGGMLSSGDIQMANSKDLLSNNSTLSGYWYLGNSTTASVSDTTLLANNYRTRRGLLVASESAYGFCSTNNAFGATDTYLRRAGAGSVGVYEADGTTLGTVQASTFSNPSGVTTLGSPSGVLLSGRFLDWASFGSGYNVRMGGGTELQVGGTTDITWASTSDARSTKDLRLARDSSGVMGVWADTAKTVRGDIAAGDVTADQFIPTSRPQVSASSGTLLQDLLTALDLTGIVEKVA